MDSATEWQSATHLRKSDNWTQPSVAADNSAQLMVQCMEAWFVADRQSLGAYFGKDFRAVLPAQRDNVEAIAKNDLEPETGDKVVL